MNLGLQLSRQFSNRWIFFLQPFPHCGRILFVRSSHRLLRGQTPGSQIASHRPHRNLQIEFSRQQILHRFPRPQCKGQVQLVRTTTDNVAHRRGCLMWCQSRNWRLSSTSRFQRSTSYAFHQPPSSGSPYLELPRKPEPPRFAKDLSERPQRLAGEGLLELPPTASEHLVFPCPTRYHITV